MNYLNTITKNEFISICILILGFCTSSLAQSEAEIKLVPFLINVESTENGLKFTCPKGCAWTTLSFSLKTGEIQAVNQEGMTNEISNHVNEDNGLADFHFEVSKDDRNIYLKGLKGTAWLDLSFTSGSGKNSQYFNEFGTLDID